MTLMHSLCRAAALFSLLSLSAVSVHAADYPAPKEGDYVEKDFKFHTGETMPELRMHYTTIGDPSGEPVLILHGTLGSGTGLLTPAFADELFGPGQALDATKYFIILPDNIGIGKSAKPSDGLRAKFPDYDYDDDVLAQYRLVTEGLGIHHLRLVLGYSMGGMQTWIWGGTYPSFMDALVPMAAQPTPMSSRNWMMRRMVVDAIRNDPDWKGGDYTEQPKAIRTAHAFFLIATSGGTQAYQKAAPTVELADKYVDDLLKAPLPFDANDYLYQWASSHDYDASKNLEQISAKVLAINAQDDERNPPETGVMDAALKRVKNAKLYLIPASSDTRGHATNVFAKFWNKQLQDFLATVPKQGT